MGTMFFLPSARTRACMVAVWLSLTFGAGDAIAADPVAEGRMLYRNKCGGCHSVEVNRTGPRHRDVVGRRVASVPGYDYSDALEQLGGRWTPMRLDRWLSGTQEMAPGSRMYLALDDAGQRQRIIAYLQSVSAPGGSR